MKKILYILSIMALVGCMNEETFIVDNPVTDSYGSFSSPLEISVGDSQTKAFDGELKWTWEESDKIYGYQVAGGKSVNTLSFVEDNRFGTPEFVYSSQNAATFHFVYAGDAIFDETAEGSRGVRQDSRQSGEWRPVLVGSAVGKTISEVMNDEAEIDMEHLSAALEVRLWKEGVDKNNLTDADKKNIVYAELMSDTENFLLDIVPVYNQNGTVSYTERERGEDEEDGGYIRTEYVNRSVAVFNIAPHAENYQAGALRLAIMDENGDRYVLDVPALNFVAGQRTILNVEWKTPTSAYLPEGPTFNSTVDAFMTGKGITEIKFITNSTTTSENALVDGSIYLLQNGQTLEIHTAASQFMANTNCNSMFNAYEGWDYSTHQYILNSFGQIQTIDFGENFNTQNVTDMSGMFWECSSLTSLDVRNFETQKVTTMYGMFYYCTSLTSLDLSNFDTQNVTDMTGMFWECSNLTSLDLSNFDTQNVTTMYGMFYYCTSLTSLDLSNFDTHNVTDMSDMFSSCSSLTSLDLSNFDTQNVTDMGHMFYNCSRLTSLDLSNFNTQNVTSMYRMFYDCSSLTSLDVSNFDTRNVTNMGVMFSSCSSLTSLDLSKFNTQNVTDMGSMFSWCSNLTSLDLSNFETQNVTDMGYMFRACTSLTSLDLSNFDTRNVTNMGHMFSSCSSLTSLDLSNFDTQNVTDMNWMFSSCSSLTSLDLSNFDTQNVTDMRYMFEDCSNLTSLDLSNFTFESNPDVYSMFSSTGSNATNKPIPIYVSREGKVYLETTGACNIDNNYATLIVKGIAYLPDGSIFNSTLDAFMTGKGITQIKFITNSATTSSDVLVENSIYLVQNGQTLEIHTAASQFVANSNCSYMFAGGKTFKQIKTIEFGENFNTQNVTNMFDMFSDCSDLTSLDLSSFDTQNVTDMCQMFYGCSSLTSLNLSNFNTQNVTDMCNMFYDCSDLTSLDLSSFDTQNVTTMNHMFQACTSLTSLDLSSFHFNSNPTTHNMFYNTGSKANYKPIPIYVTSAGKSYIETKGDCSIGLYNATLTIKGTEYPSGIGYLPSGPIFYTYVNAFMTGKEISEIKFITNSNTTSENALVDGSIYLVQIGQTLEIHTAANQFIANTNCDIMFSGRDNSQYNAFKKIKKIEFGEHFNTENVKGMKNMFFFCSSLTSLDLSNFTFESNPDIENMFLFTGSNATNKPIPIYVSAEGKSYIETKGDSGIDSNYATLTIKVPQTE